MARSFGSQVLAKRAEFHNSDSYRWMIRMTLSFPHRLVAETLAIQLSEENHRCEVIGDEYDDEWLCRVERSIVNDETLLTAWADRIQMLVSAAGGEIEDWECGVSLGEFCPADLVEQLQDRTGVFSPKQLLLHTC